MNKLNNPPSGPVRVRKVAFYVRVSTENQARVAEGSLKNQEQMLSAELRRRNNTKKWGRHVGSYVDGGFSGKNTERPEFKRLMADVERGTVDAIFFTELSRLSRSLRDFLNIFEYTQKHGCDLICLKTEIDTTSPYSNMVTKMLMIFAEFEREVTAERISRNAYERSKRGLAYGGFAPLGYRRDPEHKGRLIVDENADIIKDIFPVYIKKRSLLETLKIIKKQYHHPRVAKLSRNGIYGILTSKVYIGIREIQTAEGVEEVPGAWEAIINKDIYYKVADILKANGPGQRSTRHSYIFSGLIRCAKCEQKLQGKSGKGRSGQARYYYAHSGRCAEGGLHSIEAEDGRRLVEDWLHVLSKDEDRLGVLVQNGLKELRKRQSELFRNLKQLDHEDAALRKKLADSTARTLAAKASATNELLEREAEELLSHIQKNERETERLKGESESLTAILNVTEESFFHIYAEHIKKFIGLSAREKSRGAAKFFKTVTMGDEGLHIELYHPHGQSFANQDMTIVRDTIPLPGVLLVKNKALLRRLYHDEKLSARAISRRLNAASSTVWDHLHRFGLIAEAKEQKKRAQQVPFGFDYQNGRFISNRKEQQTIRLMRQLRAAGLTYRDIATHLNRRLVSTKRGGAWRPSTIFNLLSRRSENPTPKG